MSLPTKPAVAAIAVIPSELPIAIRTGTPTTTIRSGTSTNPPPAPTAPAASPTPPATTAVRSGGDRRVAPPAARPPVPPGPLPPAAPPIPRSPEKKAPRNPTPTRVAASERVTRPAAPARAPDRSAWLPDARPVGRQVGELLVGNRSHQRLQRLELIVGRAAPVGLEEQHLVAEISRRLAREIGDPSGWVALARHPVADRALDRGGATALDRRGLWLDRRRGARLRREVGGHVVHAELENLFRVGLHLGRLPLAGRVVLDRLLEVPGGDAREDRHRVRLALAAEAVAGAADKCLGRAGTVERAGRGGAGDGDHEEQAHDEGHRVVLSHRASRACPARCCWPNPRRSAPTSPTGRAC